jgi:ATP-dependent Clp protease ATP-binding subunit ClpA
LICSSRGNTGIVIYCSKKTEKNIFIGRDKEINEIIGDLKDNKSNRGTNLLLVGESSIGKSASLDEIHRRLTEERIIEGISYVKRNATIGQ